MYQFTFLHFKSNIVNRKKKIQRNTVGKKVPLIWIHEVLAEIYSALVVYTVPIFHNPVFYMGTKMDSNHLKIYRGKIS